MDKKKTGSLIKEARTKKSYTQRELGDLLGVTNKAVSRWENGESFPDVGVLENLSAILDIRIQDIVTGEVESNSESAINEIVRFARLQQREKKRKLIRYGLILLNFLCCLIVGYAGLCGTSIFSVNNSTIIYIVFLIMSLAFSSYGIVIRPDGELTEDNKFSRRLRILSIISLAWCIIVTWMFLLLISNGYIPFGMRLSSVGPFLNWQLIVIFAVNVVILGIELYRNNRRDVDISWGYMVSVAAIYLTSLYGDMLHGLATVDAGIKILVFRTVLILIGLFISILLRFQLMVKRCRPGQKM